MKHTDRIKNKYIFEKEFAEQRRDSHFMYAGKAEEFREKHIHLELAQYMQDEADIYDRVLKDLDTIIKEMEHEQFAKQED